MQSAELNERLTRVGPGTPMGELLRRYWYPVATSEELDGPGTKRVRVLGEDLVLFRSTGGSLGLVQERCPHRGASLAYGIPQEDGLRCAYHGWRFDTSGECLEQPFQSEDSPRFREQCGIRAYDVEELGGLVFAYLGPRPAPVLPRYDLYVREEGPDAVRAVGIATIPCNWLQIMDNSFDPTHVEWLHGHLFNYLLARSGEPLSELGGRHVKVGFDRFDEGIIKRRLREGQSELDDDWQVGHPAVFPNILKFSAGAIAQFQIRVPIDDENTRHYWLSWFEIDAADAGAIEAVAGMPRTYEVPVFDDDGNFLVDTIDGQDMMVWASQGKISDRTTEHLAQSDRGVVMFRKLLEEQLDIVEAGGDPMAVHRTLPEGGVIELPSEQDKVPGLGGSNYLAEFLRTQAKFSPVVQELERRVRERMVASNSEPETPLVAAQSRIEDV